MGSDDFGEDDRTSKFRKIFQLIRLKICETNKNKIKFYILYFPLLFKAEKFSVIRA